MHIWTDSPINEIWHQLRYLRSPANLVNLLTGKIPSSRTPVWSKDIRLEHRAYEISCCIKQADEYFRASQIAGLATKPLLQFYSSQALAKAAILANDQTITLGELNYHGLSSRASTALLSERDALQNYTKDSTAWTIEDEFAVTNAGVFPNLGKITGENEVGQGLVFRLKDLFLLIPDLSVLFTRHYGEPSHALYLYGTPQIEKSGQFAVFFSGTTKDIVLSVFPEFGQGYEFIDGHGHHGFRSFAKLDEKPAFAAEVRGSIAGTYFVRRHATGLVQPLTVLYVAQFILSNVVRYKPAFWMSILDGTTTGAAAIVEAFCNLAERRFPCETLETIWHERFTFGSPGYMV